MNGFFYIVQHGKEDNKTALTNGGCLADFAPDGAICALTGGRILSLAAVPHQGARVQFLFPREDELASRVFLRGAVFLLYVAAKELYPQRTLVVEHLLCGGAYCTLGDIKQDEIVALSQRIDTYIAADAPFVQSVVSPEDAKSIYRAQGMVYKTALLEDRPCDDCKMYAFGEYKNYLFGAMPKSAGYLSDMRLKPYMGGLILKYPAPYREPKTPIVRQSKYSAVFRQAEQWAQMLGVSYVTELNDTMRSGKITDIIRVNEALHEKTIADIASEIASDERRRVVLIAGPSSSGKTTFASRLRVHMQAIGKKSRVISLDNYYRDRDDIPVGADGRPDFECLEALDIGRLGSDLKKLISGETVQLPVFDFITGKRSAETMAVNADGEILILEGIHGLNDKLTADVASAHKFKIFISPLTTLNLDDHNIVIPEDVRLLRRLVRDQRTRGYTFAQTFELWDSVRRGEFAHILPYQETADVMFNSTLVYEPLVLKKYAALPLSLITADMPCYARAHGLLKILNIFSSLDDESEVPINSILREFIGKIGDEKSTH